MAWEKRDLVNGYPLKKIIITKWYFELDYLNSYIIKF